MTFGLVLVTFAHYPAKLIDSVERSRETVTWYIHHHGSDVRLGERIAALAERPNVRVFMHRANRGLSKSWNEGLRDAYGDGCEMALIVNDDLFFVDDGFDRFVMFLRAREHAFALAFVLGLETGGSIFAGTVQQQGFACCALAPMAIEVVGYLDQNFAPAYYEDIDYELRCRKADLPIVCTEEVLVEHERSKTTRTSPDPRSAGFIERNALYFQQKWNSAERSHAFPFDDRRLALKIGWADRANPYGGGTDGERRDMAMSASIPSGFFGTQYYDVLADVSAKRATKTYLELGVSAGFLLQHIQCSHAICVDPAFMLSHNVVSRKHKVTLYNMTSDAFFKSEAAESTRGGSIDLAFLDGMHTFEFLLRDFYNTEAFCDPSSLIVLHDCLPLNAEMALRDVSESLAAGQGSAFANYWTGDVWKLVPILKKYRPDLRLVFVDAPPTGLVFVTNLDPASTSLKQHYLDIVDEFRELPNTLDEIGAMYEGIKLTSTASIMKDMDQTLFFRP